MDTLNEGRLKIKKYFDLDTETLVTDLLEKTETDRVPYRQRHCESDTFELDLTKD